MPECTNCGEYNCERLNHEDDCCCLCNGCTIEDMCPSCRELLEMLEWQLKFSNNSSIPTIMTSKEMNDNMNEKLLLRPNDISKTLPIPPGYCIYCHIQLSYQLRDLDAVVPIKCPRCKRELVHRTLPFEFQVTNARTPRELENFLIFLLKINTLPHTDRLQIEANMADLKQGKMKLTWHH